MLKYIFFVLFFGFLLHHLAVRISLPIYDFLQVIIVLIQVYNWEIRYWLIGLSLWTCWYFILMRDSLPIWLKGSQFQGYRITFTFKIVLRFLARETRDECCHSPRERRTRQWRDWVLNETNMATDHWPERTLVQWIGSKVKKLDFWNSDLSFSSSFTYSSTLGFIHDLKTLAGGMAEVVKNLARVLWGKLPGVSLCLILAISQKTMVS